MRQFTISPSTLKLYLNCPRSWFYGYHPDIPRMTDYARLCGIQVHRHIAQMESRPTAEPRRFFFSTRKAAISAWINRWKRALESAAAMKQLIISDPDQVERYQKVGIGCIAQYWSANLGRPRPLAVEARHEINLENGLRLKGIFDQVREVPLAWITRHRPELVINGRLADGYSDQVIVDLKTDYLSYDARQFKENPSVAEEVRLQYELHEGIQATLYTFLFERIGGAKPLGFVWYHLRSGKAFFTYREERDYVKLFSVIRHVLENVNAQSFPPREGRHCRTCDHMAPCRENRHFLLVKPEDLAGEEGVELVPNLVEKDPMRQLRLKLKAERRVEPLPMVAVPDKPMVLRNLPWDEEPQE